jgi:anaerobic magnesium-protoporphyrin IX monomethyl ester cyclase
MVSIVFINPPTPDNRKITRNCDCASESKGNYLLQPFDFLYLSSRIDPNVDFTFIDAVADKLSSDEAIIKIKSLKPTHIVTAIVDLCWSTDLEFIHQLKGHFSGSNLFAFGDALVETENRKVVLEAIDGIIDNAFLFDISQTYDLNKKDFLNTKIPGLSSDPIRPPTNKTPVALKFSYKPKHQKFINSNYRWPFARHRSYTSVASNWGCPFACTYCIDSIFPFYYRDSDNLLEEMRELEQSGVKELVFTDKSFGHPRKNTLAFLDDMKKMNFSWSTYLHPLQCDNELLKAMAEAGCHTVIIGVESNRAEHLKVFNRNTNTVQIQNAITNAHKWGIDVCGDFLIGLPTQNYADVLSLIDYSINIDLDFASFNIAAPLPGSEIKKIAINEGRMLLNEHHYDSVGNIRILPTNYLNEEELKRLRNLANRKFYIRTEMFVKRIKKIKTFEHLWIQVQEGLQLFFKN